MKRILLLILLTVGNEVLAQERIDTLYYNRSGPAVRNPVFADYYRLVLYPADSVGVKMFKDFYISGELRREGHFQTIDTLDDRRTIFDGNIVSYFKNGRISEKSYYSGGLLEGGISAVQREWNVENACVICWRRIVRNIRNIQRRRHLPNGGILCRATDSRLLFAGRR